MYAVLVIWINYRWSLIPIFEASKTAIRITISLIIAARNEAENLPVLLHAINRQTFPFHNLEIIIIDDDSDDDTTKVIASLQNQLPNLKIIYQRLQEGFGKKAAITQGIHTAQNQLIVTTDADCVPQSEEWLATIANFYAIYQPKIIAAPVLFYQEKNILGYFQSADFAAMMAVTAVGIDSHTILMCNGANLAYPRAVFYTVNGFEGNQQTASGDDVFLLHKIAALYPNDIYFLQSPKTIVKTEPKHTWADFMMQRLRWGTKNTAYKDKKIIFILGIVWLYSVTLLLCLPVGLYYYPVVTIANLCSKMVVDFLLLRRVAPFFNRYDLLRTTRFLPSFFIYLYYMLVVGGRSLLQKKYEWKAREVQ